MSDAFRFETFVDAHSNIFHEYLGSVVAKLSRENGEYRAIRAEIESLYDMEMQSVYFRGCYDSVGYLKKAGIL